MEQREGRILRQGNTNKKVHFYRYVTEGTFDSYNWQTVENKQKFISQVVTGKSPARTCDDIDDAALSYADVNKLTVLRSAYQNDQYKLQDDVNKNIPDSIVKKEKMLAALRQDSSVFRANTAQADGETFRMEIGGTAYTAKDKAGAALLTLLDDERTKISNNLNRKLSEPARHTGHGRENTMSCVRLAHTAASVWSWSAPLRMICASASAAKPSGRLSRVKVNPAASGASTTHSRILISLSRTRNIA